MAMSWSFDYCSDSSVWHIAPLIDSHDELPIILVESITNNTIKKKTNVNFSSKDAFISVPNRLDYKDIVSDLWWSKAELFASSQKASLLIRETIQSNPWLTVESAMCMLYQSDEMFNARIRLLIVNNDNSLARQTLIRITTAQRANIWSVQFCTIAAAIKITANKSTAYFDVILIQTSSNMEDYFLLRRLLLGLNHLRKEKTIIGVHFDEAVDDQIKARIVADTHVDFIWKGVLSWKPQSEEQGDLRNLLAVRHLRAYPVQPNRVQGNGYTGSDDDDEQYHIWKKEIRSSCGELVFHSVFSYPLGYSYRMNAITN